MPLNDYSSVNPINAGSEKLTAKKGNRPYRLKLYKEAPFPAGESLNDPRVKARVMKCEALLRKRQRMNNLLKAADGGTGCIAYAEDVFLHRGKDYPGVIEAVREINGACELAFLRENPQRVESALVSAAEALAKLHAAGIVHADIKPENMLFVTRGANGNQASCILIDFDRSFPESEVPGPDDIGGTPGYIAPEVVAYQNDMECEEDGSDSEFRDTISSKRDIFSLGIVYCQLLLGKIPEMRDGAYVLEDRKVRETINAPYLVPLIEAMLERAPEKRPTAEAVLESLQEHELTLAVEPFEELWPEHAARYAYASKLNGYRRIRRLEERGEHQYAVTYDSGTRRVFSIEMLRRVGIVNGGSAIVSRRPVPPKMETVGDKAFTVNGVQYEKDKLWPEQERYVINRRAMAILGYEAFYRTQQEGVKGYAVYKANEGYVKKSVTVLRMEKCLVEK